MHFCAFCLFLIIPLIHGCFPGMDEPRKNEGRGGGQKVTTSLKMTGNQRFLQKHLGDPNVSINEANSRFQECCTNSGLLDDCLNVCRYDVDKAKVLNVFYKGNCNVENIFTYIHCASGGDRSENVTQCCEISGVYAGALGSHCKTFCQKDPPTFQIHHNITNCGAKFNKILDCYWFGMKP